VGEKIALVVHSPGEYRERFSADPALGHARRPAQHGARLPRSLPQWV